MTQISDFLQGDAARYGCQIMSYRTSLSQLRILISTPDTLFYLDFNGVRYIEAPMAWNDASFKTASHDDKMNFVLSKPSLRDLPMQAVDELFNLYAIDSIEVNILASNVFRAEYEQL